MDNEIRESFWKDAAKSGGAIGLFVAATLYITVLFELSGLPNLLMVLIEISGLVFLTHRFTKQRSLKYGHYGITIGQCMGFVLTMMLFAGFIYGVANYMLLNFISEEYYDIVYQRVMKQSAATMNTPEMDDMVVAVLGSALFWIFAGVLTMCLYGGIIGLTVSAFVRRKPEFTNNNNGQEQ